MSYKKINKYSSIILTFLFCFMIDYRVLGDTFRIGKQRILFILAPLFIPFLLKEQFYPALLLSYALAVWANSNFLIYSVMDIVSFSMCLAAAQVLIKQPKIFIGRLFVYFAAFQALYGLLQVCGIQLLYGVKEPFFQNLPIAFMGQHTILGCFLAACLAPALWLNMPLCSFLIVTCALFTGSSTTYMSLWAVISLFIYYRKNLKCFLLAQIAPFAALLYLLITKPKLEIFNLQQRPRLWSEGLQAFKTNPIFGGGPGYWAGDWQPAHMPVIDNFTPTLLHSEPVTLLVEYGVIGAVICLICGVIFMKKFKLTWYHTVCVSILINGLANFPFHIVPTGILFLCCLGYSMNENLNKGVLKNGY